MDKETSKIIKDVIEALDIFKIRLEKLYKTDGITNHAYTNANKTDEERTENKKKETNKQLPITVRNIKEAREIIKGKVFCDTCKYRCLVGDVYRNWKCTAAMKIYTRYGQLRTCWADPSSKNRNNDCPDFIPAGPAPKKTTWRKIAEALDFATYKAPSLPEI